MLFPPLLTSTSGFHGDKLSVADGACCAWGQIDSYCDTAWPPQQVIQGLTLTRLFIIHTSENNEQMNIFLDPHANCYKESTCSFSRNGNNKKKAMVGTIYPQRKVLPW